MTQQNNHQTILTKPEFETLILIYAAHVDYEFSESEIQYIESQTTPLTYKNMLEKFNNMTDYVCMKIIIRHKNLYVKTDEQKNELLEKLKNLFKADGDYSRIEKSFLQFFKRFSEV